MITSYKRGHKIKYIGGRWLYVDSNSLCVGNRRVCKYCSAPKNKNGHDGCIGILPGIKNACCGHGLEKEAYIQFLDNFRVDGKDAIAIIDILKRRKSK